MRNTVTGGHEPGPEPKTESDPDPDPESVRRLAIQHPFRRYGQDQKTSTSVGSDKNCRNYEVFLPAIHVYKSDPDLLKRYDFYEKVSADIKSVLSKEAPISKELLSRRVMAAWSVTKIGRRIDACLVSVFAQMKIKHTYAGRKFFWDEGQDPNSYIYYRVAGKGQLRREAEDIPPEEISNAVHKILTDQISLSYEDLIRKTARVFGFERLGDGVRASVIRGIDKAVSRGYAIMEGDRVSAAG